MSTTTTQEERNEAAAKYEAVAAKHAQDREDSFDRCDTDGFLSQWASGISSSVAQLQAEIERNGGVSEFPALFDLEGNRVPAKLIEVRDRFNYGRPKDVWALINPQDPEGRFVGFVNRPNGGPRSHKNLAAKGYVEGKEMAPAKAKVVGTGYGLSGSAWAAVVRTDRGW